MRLSKIIEILENKAIAFYKKNKDSIPRYILILFIILYAAGFVVHSVTTGLHNFQSGSNDNLFIIDPVKNIKVLFTPAGIGTVLFGFLMFLLFSVVQTGKTKRDFVFAEFAVTPQRTVTGRTQYPVGSRQGNFIVMRTGDNGRSGMRVYFQISHVAILEILFTTRIIDTSCLRAEDRFAQNLLQN